MKKFFHVSNDDLPRYLLPFAIGSFLGPMVLGPLFDKIGRKPMITATYGTAGLLLLGMIYPSLMAPSAPVDWVFASP